MIHWEKMSVSEIHERWVRFIKNRTYGMSQDHPDFISMSDREGLIHELLNRKI